MMLAYARRWAAACVIVYFAANPAGAAEFKKWPLPNGMPDAIAVIGDLELGDEKKFINTALTSSDAIVMFQSRGGNLLAGIEIGKAIRLKGFSTLVPDEMQCASACALAWLGGRVRFMSATARIGFHAVYTDTNGRPTVSSAGNALVGAYVNQLGLSNTAVIYITGAAPSAMQWLTLADAQRSGIDVKLLNLSASNRNVSKSSTSIGAPAQAGSTENLSPVDQIAEETYSFVRAINLPRERALSYLSKKYSDPIDYYGKSLTRGDVLRDKKDSFISWPVRTYAIRPKSLEVICPDPSFCMSEGALTWNNRGLDSASKGEAEITLTWALQNGLWKITGEMTRDQR